MVWVLQPSLKVGGTHGRMEAAESHGQRARGLGVYPSVSLCTEDGCLGARPLGSSR